MAGIALPPVYDTLSHELGLFGKRRLEWMGHGADGVYRVYGLWTLEQGA
jgi:hypothetical protein